VVSQHPLQLVGEQIPPPLDVDPLPELDPLDVDEPVELSSPLDPLLEELASSLAGGMLASSPVAPVLAPELDELP
jgi:hypothetical protein